MNTKQAKILIIGSAVVAVTSTIASSILEKRSKRRHIEAMAERKLQHERHMAMLRRLNTVLEVQLTNAKFWDQITQDFS